MTDKDLDRLQAALDEFHQYKHVLVGENNLYKDDSRFDLIAKLHQLHHYLGSTHEMGTPGGFSTEGPEHMHIKSAKVPWRVSNKVQPTQQMVKFVQRYKALQIHRAYVDRFPGIAGSGRGPRKSQVVYEEEVEGPAPGEHVGRSAIISGKGGGEGEGEGVEVEGRLEGEDEAAEGEKVPLEGSRSDANEHVVYPNPTLSIALWPAVRLRGLDIIAKYGATDLIHALHMFLKNHPAQRKHPTTFLPTTHHKYKVWHRLYLHHEPLSFNPENVKRNVICAQPQGPVLGCAFNVALLLYCKNEPGLH
ncbi:hypothetical protein FRC06_010601, partial [Ceratobasidium sp. 370]